MTEMLLGSQYEVTYKTFIFKRKTKVDVSNLWKNKDQGSSKKIKFNKSHLSLWGIEARQALSIYYFRPRALNAFSMNLKLYRLVLSDGSKKSVIEILDMIVPAKLRSKSIGSQALSILEQIGKENSYELIIGELQAGDDLEKRKTFFANNDFELFYSPKIKFSGWAIKKDLSSTH